MPAFKNPFKGFVDLRRSELPLALTMFGYWFLVITTFWILKPLKKAAFISFYKESGGFHLLGGDPLTGSQTEQLAKVGNMLVAFVAALVFGLLARRLRRQQLTWIFSGFSVLALLAFVFAPAAQSEVGVWLFYLFGDLFNTLMVATFFAFLNDSFAPADARRAYGPIVLGGVIGGAVGSIVLASLIEQVKDQDIWLWVCIGAVVGIVVLATIAGRLVRARGLPEVKIADPDEEKTTVFTGMRLIAKSKYLLALVTMVGIYELVSATLDFQFSATIEALPADEVRSTFATVFATTNVFAMVFQLVMTGFIMQKWGPRRALLVLPIAIAGAATGFMVLPMVLTASALSFVDNGLNYSLNQSARESLYTVTSRREKYQAKAFIDMFVQRFAKALAVGLVLLFTTVVGGVEDVRWLSIIPLVGAAVWFFAARYAGREFDRREAKVEKSA